MSPIDSVLFPGLVNHDLGNVCDLQTASIAAFRVVNFHGQVGHFSCDVEVFREGDIQGGRFVTAKESYLFVDLDWHIELGVVHDRSYGGYVDALSITQFALTPPIVKQVGFHGDELCLEEVA